MTRAKKRDQYLRKTYGLTLEQFNKALKAQGGKCAICRRPPKPGKNLHVDHDHRSGRVRGLLNYFCNHRLLGRGRENPDHHEAAAKYLRATIDWRKA